MQEKTTAYESYQCTLRELQISLTVEVNLTFSKNKCCFFLQAEYKKKQASEPDEKLQFLQSLEELIKTSSFFEDFPVMMDVVNSLRRFYKRTIIPSDREEEKNGENGETKVENMKIILKLNRINFKSFYRMSLK